jgi:mRNA interferase HigB
MRIISVKKIKEFWESGYSDSEVPLKNWYRILKEKKSVTPVDIKNTFPAVSFVGDNRVIFNIGGNKYRLVSYVRYDLQILYIRFIGTHAKYDKIDVMRI